MTRKRILVTGGAGFISSNVVRHLLARSPHEVVSLDALTYAGNMDNLTDVLGHERLSFVHGDVRDRDLVGDIVRQVDVIVNAAAESHVEKSIVDGAREFVTTNVEGTQILLDAVRRDPVERFVLISSSEVYGTAERDPMDEGHPLNPRSPYAATKIFLTGGSSRPSSRWTSSARARVSTSASPVAGKAAKYTGEYGKSTSSAWTAPRRKSAGASRANRFPEER